MGGCGGLGGWWVILLAELLGILLLSNTLYNPSDWHNRQGEGWIVEAEMMLDVLKSSSTVLPLDYILSTATSPVQVISGARSLPVPLGFGNQARRLT